MTDDAVHFSQGRNCSSLFFNNTKTPSRQASGAMPMLEDNDEDDKEDTPAQAPLALTQGQEEDQGEEEAKFDEGVEGTQGRVF